MNKDYKYTIDNRQYCIEYPKAFHPDKLMLERERTLNSKGIKGKVKEMVFNGICIELRQVQVTEPITIEVDYALPFLKMHFELGGYSSYLPQDLQSLEVEIKGGHHQLFFFPKVKGSLNYKPYNHRNTLEITLSIEFIQRVFGQNWHQLMQLGEAITGNEPIVVGSRSMKINPDLEKIITDISYCPVKGVLKQYYLEAKVIELLIIQIQSLSEDSFAEKEEISKIDQVALFLKENLDQSKTIDQLAKQVGMNSTQLKKDFKETFNETIFGYHTRLKMEYAKEQILYCPTKSITHIASEIGYSYVQHFSKAFKKHHGIRPSEYRKQ